MVYNIMKRRKKKRNPTKNRKSSSTEKVYMHGLILPLCSDLIDIIAFHWSSSQKYELIVNSYFFYNYFMYTMLLFLNTRPKVYALTWWMCLPYTKTIPMIQIKQLNCQSLHSRNLMKMNGCVYRFNTDFQEFSLYNIYDSAWSVCTGTCPKWMCQLTEAPYCR